MTYKLIAIDLDGTLLDSHHQVSAANVEAVQACLARGIEVVIATGRLFSSAGVFCRQIGLTGPTITLNGAFIVNAATGEMEGGSILEVELMERILAELRKRNIEYTVFGSTHFYVERETDAVDILHDFGEPHVVKVPSMAREHVEQPAKILAFLDESETEIEAELRQMFEHECEVVRTGKPFFEFLSLNVNKGAALAQLLERYQIDPSEVMVIGDSFNDLSMFELAGMSVAMAGASPAVQERANAITTDNDDDGVALALRRYVLEAE